MKLPKKIEFDDYRRGISAKNNSHAALQQIISLKKDEEF